ncbi:MAG: LON peptidase substrate-binding domain-containing protein [Chitinophagaceae bacterium]
MINFIPIFPLEIIVYPGEELNLHVFEPRYRELVDECVAASKPFGIPIIIKNNLNELGTLVEITEISKRHPSGDMDIKTRGSKIFRILEIIKEVPEKHYSGAIVNYPQNREDSGKKVLMQALVKSIKDLHRLLNVNKDFKKSDDKLNSYDLAHHAGLSVEQEYEFLGLFQEAQRQEFLKRHLAKVLPVLAEMEVLKEKVKLNGHFKNLSASGFEL